MWLGVKGILSCRRNGHDQIFLIAFCGYLVVGTGSFLFHSTLKCKLLSSTYALTYLLPGLEQKADLMHAQTLCSLSTSYP